VQLERRNVFLLACCQALLLTNAVTLIAIGALAGYELASDKALSTLPATIYVIGGALTAFPASMYMKRVGRRAGFLVGGALGLAGAVLVTFAIASASFALLCAGHFLLGCYNGFGQYFRFAAADTAPPDFKAKAISLVTAGGVVGGIVGPELTKITIDLGAPTYFRRLRVAHPLHVGRDGDRLVPRHPARCGKRLPRARAPAGGRREATRRSWWPWAWPRSATP
jgi:MFS family permease